MMYLHHHTTTATWALLAAYVQARRGDLAAQLSALRARCEELGAQLSATPQPTTSCKALAHLQQASERLAVLQHIQVKRPGPAFGGSRGFACSLAPGLTSWQVLRMLCLKAA